MSLINIEKTIALDVYDHNTTPSVIKTIQMDTGTRTVFAVIQNSGQAYDIGQNATVSLTVLRPDKTKVQITGQTFSYTGYGSDATAYGARADLSDIALAAKGNLKAQFKITSGAQELRTEIFTINNGEALDAGDGDWAGDLDGHNLDEMAQSIEDLSSDVSEIQGDVSELKEGLNELAEQFPGSDNVYNPANEVAGVVMGSDGTETQNVSYTLNTEYIPATTGQYVSCFGANSTGRNGVAFVAYYNADKEFIQRKSTQYGSVINFTIDPTNVSYIRVCVWVNSTDVAVYINDTNPGYTDDSFPYEPYEDPKTVIRYSVLPDTVQSAVVAANDIADRLNYGYWYTNITDSAEYFTSAYISSSRVITLSSAWCAYILQIDEIPDFSEIVVESYANVTGRYQVAFYSAATPTDSAFISGITYTVGSSKNTAVITEIPSNAVSVLITNLIALGSISVTVKSAIEMTDVDKAEEDISELSGYEKRELRARFDNQFNYIAYSAMMVSGAGPNSEAQYLWGAQRKFVSIKGDVRISSDGKIVMCHDEGFTFDQNGNVTDYDANNMTPIRNMTSAQCYALIYAGTTDHVCGLDALVRTCKLYGKIAFITVRSSYLDEIFPEIFGCLDRYNMRERAIINGFSYETMKKARKYDKNITLSWVQIHNHKITNDDVDKADRLGNCLITCYDYSGSPETKAINQDDAVLKYAMSKDVRLYEAIIGYGADLNNAELYDRGFTGAQVAFEPQIFSTFA